MEKKKGIIKRISVKGEGRNAFILDGNDQWYNGFSLEGAKIGDEIEFDAEVNQTDKGTFHNFKNISVVDYVSVSIGGEGNKVNDGRYDVHDSIVAQCLTKIEFRNHADPKPLDILESYRHYLKELSNVKAL